MKGAVKSNHMAVNKFQLLVIGLPPLTPLEISGIEEELQAVDLPDRTKASGGNTAPVEFTMMLPMHHTVEHAAMEVWFRESQDPVQPTYKKPATLLHQPIGPGAPRTFQLIGVFPTKRKLPDLEMANEGELAMVEWTLSADQVLPVS
jgi:hypothetical protein